MPSPLAQHRTFLAEFRRNFQTTGAILPSGRFLARALTRHIASLPEPRRILEAGPGTGAVTTQLLRHLGPHDRVDLVEWNPAFVDLLQQRFAIDPAFRPAADRCRVIHDKIETFDSGDQYDLIVSGLPLNNFDVELVEAVLKSFERLLRPGGMLSFFEYIAVRRVKATISSGAQRARLRGIERVLSSFLAAHSTGRDMIWCNVPPAWVHHLRVGQPTGSPR